MATQLKSIQAKITIREPEAHRESFLRVLRKKGTRACPQQKHDKWRHWKQADHYESIRMGPALAAEMGRAITLLNVVHYVVIANDDAASHVSSNNPAESGSPYMTL